MVRVIFYPVRNYSKKSNSAKPSQLSRYAAAARMRRNAAILQLGLHGYRAQSNQIPILNENNNKSVSEVIQPRCDQTMVSILI